MNRMTKVISAIAAVTMALCIAPLGFSQTSSTGAVTGTTRDATGAVIAGVQLTITNEATGEGRSTISSENGNYAFPLLVPGSYRLEAASAGFKTAVRSGVRVNVTETVRSDFQLEVGALAERITVETAPVMVQQETAALGRVVGEAIVSNLPLSTRNFTQILGLSPGISTDVTHAGELGRGSGGQVVSRTTVNGSRPYDNSFQIDSVDTTDFHSSGFGSSPGTAVPNPDAIEEFKVQTALADASFGRNAGAQVNIITKSGTNEFHGTLFEFFRNEALNANDFFFNRAGRPKPVVKQNQYGGTIGGPIKREKLLFFGSHQGTRQINGLAAGKANATCSATISSPPLTDDRSAAALGALFGGQSGQNGGVAVLRDGSNINPVALRLLQLKLSDGSYLFSTPQVIDRSQPFARQGFSAFSRPCTFDEDQFLANVDYLQTDKSKFAGRFFHARSNQLISFGGFGSNAPSPATRAVDFAVASLAHTYIFGPHVFNEVRAGYNRSFVNQGSIPAFRFSDIGVSAAAAFDDTYQIGIAGSYNVQDVIRFSILQEVFNFQDHLSYQRGNHNFRFGGGIRRIHDEISDGGVSTLNFLSFPDFLLGLNAAQNGSPFSNVFLSSYKAAPAAVSGFWTNAFDGFAYIQDDLKAGPRLTLNLGFRYERIGHLVEANGKAINFDPARANPNPPATGTLQGFLAPSNYRGEIPAGVTQIDTPFGINGTLQNTWEPRVGFAWQMLPKSNRLVLRGGYGVYHTHPTVDMSVQRYGGGIQFRGIRSFAGTSNANATFQNPFPQPIPTEFPQWGLSSYSPTTALDIGSQALNFGAATTQQYSLNTQTEFARGFLLEIGYVGTRGTHLARARSLNQALLASPSNPIRGVTTNTVANVPLRVPTLGFQPAGIRTLESAGASWYNGLQASLTKRFSKGLQFLASYTWSKSLDTDAANVFYANTSPPKLGDQNNESYGRTILDRPHRFVFSFVYELPNFANQNGWIRKLAGGWSVSGVATIQTGTALPIGLTNGTNVTGIFSDRAQLAPGCTHGDLLTSGRLQDRLNKYFNTACFTKPPVVGSDGIATAFGNSGVGIVNGPGQYNFDMSITKKFSLRETKRLEFRGEFFNLFNTPQFSNPDTNFSSSTFGQIFSTSVNPRMVQFALKLIF